MARGLVLALWGCAALWSVAAFMPSSYPLKASWSLSSPRSQRTRAMMMKQIGVGVIGAGRIGLVHLEALTSW